MPKLTPFPAPAATTATPISPASSTGPATSSDPATSTGPATLGDPKLQAILQRFQRAAQSTPQGLQELFDYPTGEAGLRGLGYGENLLAPVPPVVRASYCGVGNPFLPGLPRSGQAVLDIGCGAGVDTLIAAGLVSAGQTAGQAAGQADGQAQGLELSPDMLQRARENARLAGARNAAFAEGQAEALPFPDATFDLVISNGVLNLVQDKPKAFAEAYRVLRPGGRVQLADQLLTGRREACQWSPGGESWAR